MEDFKSLDSKELENIEGGSLLVTMAAAYIFGYFIGMAIANSQNEKEKN
jgi:lactobin A/cerein 7B family class IIb bacteriocin